MNFLKTTYHDMRLTGILLSMMIIGILAHHKSSAQDAHISQFDALPMMVSPSNTGMTPSADIRVGAFYRNQWNSLAAGITTFGLNFDMPYKERWGVGAVFTNVDESNVLNTTRFNLSGAYLISDPNQNNFRLSTGLQVGFIYKRTNQNNLIFDNQYNGSLFDPNMPTGENFQELTRFMPDVNLGVSYVHTNRSSRFNPFIHAAVYHMTAPDESFISSDKQTLPLRWAGLGGCHIQANRELGFDPQVYFQMQGPSTEINFGSTVDYEIPGTGYTLLGGTFYRWQDAAILKLGVQHNFNTFQISYDINTSDLTEYSSGRGALEFTLTYSPGRRRSRAIY